MTKKEPTLNYTVKEIVEKIHAQNEDQCTRLEAMEKVQIESLAEQKKTNGRITRLEKVSHGVWVRNHPWKFAGIIISIISILTPLVISDFRQPIMAWVFG